MLPTTVGCLLLLGAALAGPVPEDLDPLSARQKEPREVLAVPAPKGLDPLWNRQKKPREVLADPVPKGLDPLWNRQKEPREVLAVPAPKGLDPLWNRQKEPREVLAVPAPKGLDPLWNRQKEPPAVLVDLEPMRAAVDADPMLLCPAYRGVLLEGQYYIESPRYPKKYPNNMNISWNLRGDQDQAISIGCTVFHLQPHNACRKDRLEINSMSYCGRDIVENTTSTELRIRFFTNRTGRRRGFYCLITVPDGAGVTMD